MPRSVLVLAGLLVAAPLPAAQTVGPIQPLVLEGAPLVDGARVTGVGWVNVDSFGGWEAEVTSNHPAHPVALVAGSGTSPGGPWLAVGSLLQVPGTSVAAFGSHGVELFGSHIWTGRFDGSPSGTEGDEGLFYRVTPWITEGPVCEFLSTNLPAGTRWLSFDDVRVSSASGLVMLRGRVDTRRSADRPSRSSRSASSAARPACSRRWTASSRRASSPRSCRAASRPCASRATPRPSRRADSGSCGAPTWRATRRPTASCSAPP